MILLYHSIFVFFLGMAAQAAPSAPCVKTRCALDIGSSGIKAQVAVVDVCAQTVLRTLFPLAGENGRRDVSFGAALRAIETEPHAKLKLQKLLEQGATALRDLQRIALSLHSDSCRGVATAAFRESKAGGDLAAALTRETKTPITVLPQAREGALEIYGAIARASLSGAEMKRSVVWGLGSTSQQWTPIDGSLPFDLKISSTGFLERVLAEVKKSKAHSPNPMSALEVTQARRIAENLTNNPELSSQLRKRLAAPDTIVLGIGGVLNLSVKKQLDTALTAGALQKAIDARTGKPDSDPLFLGEAHAAAQLTNLILVEAFVRKLGLHEVRWIDSNLTDGALVHPELWK